MDDASAVAEHLENVFRNIHETRMSDVPILNEALKVEAVGVQQWQEHWLAILITPWFLNLMLLPGSDDQRNAWGALKLGENIGHVFPAGRFDFIVGEEQELGRFQMCSLFSPVLEFSDHETAVATAHASLGALLEADAAAQGAPEPDSHLLNIAKGQFPTDEEIASVKLRDEAMKEPRTPQNVSRRDLFTGGSGKEEPVGP